MKIAKVGLPAENGFLDRMNSLPLFKRWAGEGEQLRPHPAGNCSMESGFPSHPNAPNPCPPNRARRLAPEARDTEGLRVRAIPKTTAASPPTLSQTTQRTRKNGAPKVKFAAQL